MLKKIGQILQQRSHLKQWEIAKYFLISAIMFSPALLSFFHHTENEYYLRIDNLLSFMAFSFSAFALLVIFRISAIWTIPFVLAAIVGDAYHLVIGKPIGFQTMAAMYETNLTEMWGFLSSPASIPLGLGGAAGAGAIIWYIARPKPLWKLTKETHIRRYYLLGLMGLALALFFIEGETILYTYPLDLFYSNYRYLDESHNEKEYLGTTYFFKAPDKLTIDNSSGKLLILIIGEAARKSALHAYGGKRPTTPQLDKFIASNPGNVTLFTDAISGSAYTRGSVPTLLSTFDLKDIEQLLKRPSLSKMFRGAGYKTLYVTTRPRYLLPNIVSIFQDDAEEVYYLSTIKNRQYDEAVIPVVQEFVKKYQSENKFIIVHLMGSHIKYSMQYPRSEQFFDTNNRRLDSYYDTIKYSDKVIQQVVDIVMAQTTPGFLLYASDHGENLNDFGDGNWGHGTREFTRFEFEIPFITYFNASFIRVQKRQAALMQQAKLKSISQDNISHTLLGLSGIFDVNYYRAEADLSSPLFKPHTRYIIDENMNTYEFDKLLFKQESKDGKKD